MPELARTRVNLSSLVLARIVIGRNFVRGRSHLARFHFARRRLIVNGLIGAVIARPIGLTVDRLLTVDGLIIPGFVMTAVVRIGLSVGRLSGLRTVGLIITRLIGLIIPGLTVGRLSILRRIGLRRIAVTLCTLIVLSVPWPRGAAIIERAAAHVVVFRGHDFRFKILFQHLADYRYDDIDDGNGNRHRKKIR